MPKCVLIVLDSVGIGAAPDAATYGDEGAATLQHTAERTGGLSLPHLEALGLGNIPPLIPNAAIEGVAPRAAPQADYGTMRERSQGKDTITGHWELAGLEMEPGFTTFPPGPPAFPTSLIEAITTATGRGVIGNCASGGIAIIDALGAEHMSSGSWIIYTSVDSVLQVASHVDVVPVEELHAACAAIRTLCDPLRVGRVIARPFRGEPGHFRRTEDRRDFCFSPPEPFVFDRIAATGVPVIGVGKIGDIYNGLGFTEDHHTGNNRDSQTAVREAFARIDDGLIMANFIDFDMLYGHRRDVAGYAAALEQTDAFMGHLMSEMTPDDVLIVTADHGNDPTYRGTDHTREYVPLLVYRPGRVGRALGVRDGFYDIAQSLATLFGCAATTRGESFI